MAKTTEATPSTRAKEYFITINNPKDKGYTHEKIKEVIDTFGERVYWCICDEIGLEEHTYHTHLYIILKNYAYMSAVIHRFKGSHVEVANGTPQQVRAYIMKDGKWEGHAKADTKVGGTQEEWGVLPEKKQGARTDLSDLYRMVAEEKPTNEIIKENPKFLFRIADIDRARQMVLNEKYKNVFRHLDVTYIWGDTGTGKTRSVMERHGYENVCRIYNYDRHPFDQYQGEDVIVFEEFRSSLKMQDMLTYLDGYPLSLPCRYADKTACYTKVYIITNIPIEKQYSDLQKSQQATWEAFKRRINHFEEYKRLSDTEVEIIKTEASEYFNKEEKFELPFK